MGGKEIPLDVRHRRLAAEWIELFDESTPAERQAARGYVLAQRSPRRQPAAAPRRWWVFPRTYPIPASVSSRAAPRASWPTRTWARQFAGLVAFCALSLIGISSIYWGPALSHAWLVHTLPLAASVPAAAGVITVWSAVVSFPLGLSVLGTHAALRQLTLVL